MHNLKQGFSVKYFMGTASFDELKKNTLDIFYTYKTNAECCDTMYEILKHRTEVADEVKHRHPDNKKEIDKYLDWLKSDMMKQLNNEAKKFNRHYKL